MENELVPHLMTLSMISLSSTSLTLWVRLPPISRTFTKHQVGYKWECILRTSRRIYKAYAAALHGDRNEENTATIQRLSGNLIEKVAERYSMQLNELFRRDVIRHPADKKAHMDDFQTYFMPKNTDRLRAWEITSLVAVPGHVFTPDAICTEPQYTTEYSDLNTVHFAGLSDADEGKYEFVGLSTFALAGIRIQPNDGTDFDLNIIPAEDLAGACNSSDLLDRCVQQLNSRLLLLENKALHP